MPITLQLNDGQNLIDWTDDVVNLPPEFGFLGATNLFDMRPTSQSAIMFELFDRQVTLLNSTSKRERNVQKSAPHKSQIVSLHLPFFAHSDYLTYEDVQGRPQAGSSGYAETIGNLKGDKIIDQMYKYNQTAEYMRMSAVKGETVTPDGIVVANMFEKLGIQQTEIVWNLSDPDFSVVKACRDLKSTLAKANKRGSAITGFEVIVGNEFLDALMGHPEVIAMHNNNTNANNLAAYLEGVGTFEKFGVTSVFNFGGIRFMTYDATFNIEEADGTVRVENAVESNVGHTILRSRGIYKGVYGNSNKLSQANKAGQPVYMYEWSPQRDESIEMEMQFSHLYYCTQPETQIKLIAQ